MFFFTLSFVCLLSPSVVLSRFPFVLTLPSFLLFSIIISFLYVRILFSQFRSFYYFIIFALLLSHFFPVYSVVSCYMSASRIHTVLLSQNWISIYFAGPQITRHMSICRLAWCVLSSWPCVLWQSEDRNLQELHVRSASQTVCRGDVRYGVLSVGVPSQNLHNCNVSLVRVGYLLSCGPVPMQPFVLYRPVGDVWKGRCQNLRGRNAFDQSALSHRDRKAIITIVHILQHYLRWYFRIKMSSFCCVCFLTQYFKPKKVPWSHKFGKRCSRIWSGWGIYKEPQR
jgi:hypothetical protein